MMLRAATSSLVIAAATIAASATSAVAQSPNQSSAAPSELQSLVNDTAFQLELSYRFNVAELTHRREAVAKALAAWNESARSEADNRKLAAWLQGAIRASMPGSQAALPQAPQFEKPGAAESLPAPRATSEVITASGTAPSAEPARTKAPSDATEHTLMRPTDTTIQPATEPRGGAALSEPEADTGDNFWSDHPGAQELPDDLSSGDPFRDDPLPTDDELFFEDDELFFD